MKLQIKLRHVNIHSYWLRQEVQSQIIHIWWVLTKQIIANGLTKALRLVNYKAFIEMISLKDQEKRLASIKFKKDQ